jgi:anhydro-N-acetylmuramic acid kinase
VARSLEQHVSDTPDELVVSGGGAFNACLMAGLARRLAPMRVVDSETALGLPVLAREAVSFALLADATLAGIAGNVPTVTGARRAVRLGKLSYGGRAGDLA